MLILGAITKKDILSYTLLPGFKKQIQEIFLSGFQYIPYAIALVYQCVRLLPAGHPYTNPSNIGRFNLRDVIAQAANHLVVSWRNIDQIILFITILCGLIMLLLQGAILLIALVFQPAIADAGANAATQVPSTFSGFFGTDPNIALQDLAFMMLDLIFGIKGIFGSCVSEGTDCYDLMGEIVKTGAGSASSGNTDIFPLMQYPFPIHSGLHALFGFYSTGLLLVGALILTYFMITIVAETAQTGTAFGKRFDKVWAPIRLVVAFGLLIPLGSGLNAAQYSVLYAAKYGSSFATNGWRLFNSAITETYVENTQELISKPNPPEVGGLLRFMFVARTCAELQLLYDNDVAGIDEIPNPLPAGKTDKKLIVAPYIISNDITETVKATKIRSNTPYEELTKRAIGDDSVTIRFGIQDESYELQRGNIYPTCGELTFPLIQTNQKGLNGNPLNPGAEIMQQLYWDFLQSMWFFTLQGTRAPDDEKVINDLNMLVKISPILHLNPDFFKKMIETYTDILNNIEGHNYPKEYAKASHTNQKATSPPASYASTMQGKYASMLKASMETAIGAQQKAGHWEINEKLLNKGWAATGLWYNKIAEMNGALTTAVLNVPIPLKYPYIMEFVAKRQQTNNQNVEPDKRFDPGMITGTSGSEWEKTHDGIMATAMWDAYSYWDQVAAGATNFSRPQGNALIDAINTMFGTTGLFSMRDNDGVHPLAKLVGVGRALVESSTRNLAYAMVGGVTGLAMKPFSGLLGGAAKTFGQFFVTIGMMGLTVGFILFYIIPFMPFIYVFFAFTNWVKGIFEAMVGAPLWALAHIRIEGGGLPGKAAMAGYFLIFEVFLRPILIVFGFLASISIFAAMVDILNSVWDLVTSNLTGFDPTEALSGAASGNIGSNGASQSSQDLVQMFRGPVDQFFFTIVYTIVVYIMAMSSFKLVNLIPQQIMRWMGQSVQTFGDQEQDPAQGLVGKTTMGTQQAFQSVGGGINKLLGVDIGKLA